MTVASVMKPAAVTLRESDTVMRAVHELVNHRLLIVPILDDGGTLTGLFGVHRLVELLLLYHTHSTLPVVEEEEPKRFLGIVSYWNVLDALSGAPRS